MKTFVKNFKKKVSYKKLDNLFELTHSSKNKFIVFLNSVNLITNIFYILFNKFLIKIDNQLTEIHKIFALQQPTVIKKIN